MKAKNVLQYVKTTVEAARMPLRKYYVLDKRVPPGGPCALGTVSYKYTVSCDPPCTGDTSR